jgi:hypothetical protein
MEINFIDIIDYRLDDLRDAFLIQQQFKWHAGGFGENNPHHILNRLFIDQEGTRLNTCCQTILPNWYNEFTAWAPRYNFPGISMIG